MHLHFKFVSAFLYSLLNIKTLGLIILTLAITSSIVKRKLPAHLGQPDPCDKLPQQTSHSQPSIKHLHFNFSLLFIYYLVNISIVGLILFNLYFISSIVNFFLPI